MKRAKWERQRSRWHGRGFRAGCALIVAAAVLTATVEKANALPRVRPYISVTATPSPFDLGSVSEPGVFDSPSELKVHVAANCNQGGVVISATPLARPGGGEIPLQRFFVKVPATGQFVAMTAPVIVAGPTGPAIFDVVLKFRVETVLPDIPGEYAGTITITCAAAP